MSDFNSRYRNIDDEPGTIRTNTGSFDFGGGFGNADMDIMEAENAQKKKQVARASQARAAAAGSKGGRKSKKQIIIYSIIIAIEVIALVVIWAMYISYNSKLSSKNGSSASAQSSDNSGSASSGSINVDNDNFTLNCTKISISTDAAGNPVALVYFTFTNKTENPLSMSQVYSPLFKQAGMDLTTASALAEEPQEIYNKDSQVSAGQSIDCAYAVTLQDTTSEITITMHDNYETFSDIGSTVVPIS